MVTVGILTLLVLVFNYQPKSTAISFFNSWQNEPTEIAVVDTRPTPFPIGVNPAAKTISTSGDITDFAETYLAYTSRRETISWFGKLERRLARSAALQQLASPISRTLVIWPGDRREEVVDHFGDILRWDREERATFDTLVNSTVPTATDGMFMPGKYVLPNDRKFGKFE